MLNLLCLHVDMIGNALMRYIFMYVP